MKTIFKYPEIFIFIFGVSLLSFTSSSFSTKTETAQLKVPPPTEFLKTFHFGYNEVLADSLWVRWIQDSDYCEQDIEKSYNPGKDLDEALTIQLKPSRCHLGWSYKMLDAITELAPKFRYAYRAGAVALGIGSDDREGAKRIYDKGLERFPTYWELVYAASYHYLFELQDTARAADLLLQAHQYGGPPWLPVLASRLYSKLGRAALGESVLIEYLKTTPEGEGAKRARERLEILKKEAQ